KVRGFRIELGEIEAALGRQKAVREAVAIVWPRSGVAADRRIVAYVVTREEISSRDLRAARAASLPEPMVPSLVVFLPELPKTTSGKLDRKALPEPSSERPDLERPYVAPATEVEKVLATIWSQVLHVDKVGRDDNFFDLGGHSLLATQVLARLQDALAVELPLADVFAAPTLSAFAARADAELEAALLAGDFDELLAGHLQGGE
ncbi:MAG TPA: phosphopantetheine-binding protein, partial [Thermoanaerobaculia bacterium]